MKNVDLNDEILIKIKTKQIKNIVQLINAYWRVEDE